jgi:uncharacterized protein (TIGR00369 family)
MTSAGPPIEKVVKFIPHLKALGIRHVEHGKGYAVLELPYADHIIGFPQTGVVAGGAIFTLMDNTCGMAVWTAIEGFVPTATLDLRIDYLKPATPGLSVFGRAECFKVTRKIAFVRGVAYHDSPEAPIAHTMGTFMLAGG